MQYAYVEKTLTHSISDPLAPGNSAAEIASVPGFLKPVAKKGLGMLERLQAAEKEYRKRLENIVDGPVVPYKDDWDDSTNTWKDSEPKMWSAVNNFKGLIVKY